MAETSLKSLKYRISPSLRGVIVFLVTFATAGVFGPFINLALDYRGLTESQIGLFSAVPGAITIITGPILSRMADKRRQRLAFITVGYILYGIFYALMQVPLGFAWLIGIQILTAIVVPPAHPIRSAISARMATKYGINFGSWRMWGSFGFAVMALVMGVVWQWIGIQWLFLVGAGFFFLSAIVVNLLEEPEEDEDIIQTNEVWHAWLPRDAEVWLFLGAATLAHMAMQPFYNFSAIHMVRMGGSEIMAGGMRSASAFVEVFMMWWASKLIKKIGAVWVFLIGSAVFALAWLGFGIATQPWMLIVITAFRGVGFAFTAVSAVMYLDSKAKSSEAASYQSLLNALSMGVGPMIAGPLGGLLAERMGLSQVFIVASAVGAGAIVLCVIILILQRKQSVRNV